ncbi:GNAT family N-acetyltransferase [Candidatus Peregrinibacteria bacterium]|nr:GNAT family N-acetyltransferase [Candidatus Peregrinibacteria bacterium]
MDTSNLTIETNNLYLKSIKEEYKNDIFREFTAEITTHMFPKPAKKIEETIEFIKTSIKENKEGSNFQIVILNKQNGDFIGCGGVHHIDRKTPELGIWIKKSAHGNAYGKETITALKKWTDENLDYDYLLYPVAADNYPSRKIPELLGGKIAREYDITNMSGKKLHILEYRIYPTDNYVENKKNI